MRPWRSISMKRILIACLTSSLMLTAQSKITRAGNDWTEETTGTVNGCQRLRVETPGGKVEVRGTASPEIGYRIVRTVKARTEGEARHKFSMATLIARRNGTLAEL